MAFWWLFMHSDDRIGLEEAIQRHVVSLNATLSEHPPIESLERFASRRGESSPGEDEALAEHLAICTECAALMRYGFAEPGRPTLSMPASAVDAAWLRISYQLQEGVIGWIPLARVLKTVPPAIEKRVSLCSDIAESLATLHGAGQLVTYLSPETVLFEPNSGRTRMMEPEAGIAFLDGSKRPTRTVRFLSPEQIAGQNFDGRSNLFSLGSLMYETICGVAPFAGRTALETAGHIVALDVRPMAAIRTDIPPEVEQLTQKLLQKDRLKRPSNTFAVAAALKAIEEGQANPLDVLEDRSESLNSEIESLYEHLDRLYRRKRRGDEDPGLDAVIDSAMVQLRQLQEEEAKLFKAQFAARLSMPIDAGKQILSRARKLKQRFASSTAENRSAG